MRLFWPVLMRLLSTVDALMRTAGLMPQHPSQSPRLDADCPPSVTMVLPASSVCWTDRVKACVCVCLSQSHLVEGLVCVVVDLTSPVLWDKRLNLVKQAVWGGGQKQTRGRRGERVSGLSGAVTPSVSASWAGQHNIRQTPATLSCPQGLLCSSPRARSIRAPRTPP